MAGRKKITARGITGLDIFFADFISEKQALNKSKATIENYQTSWKRYKEEMLSNSITQADIYSFINLLRNRGVKNQSINHYLRDLRTFVNWCVDKKYLRDIKVKLVEEEEIVQETYTDKDIMTMIQKPHKNESFNMWRTWCMLNLFFAGGMRASSACSIRMMDIDFDNNLIILSRTKNRKIIALPMAKQLVSVLKLYIHMFRSDTDSEDWLFPSVYGTQLKVNGLYQAIKDYNHKRGVSLKGSKAARHSFSKAWVRSGGSLFKLQKVLGHKSPQMTAHYADIWGKDLQEGFEEHNLLDMVKADNSRKHAITRK